MGCGGSKKADDVVDAKAVQAEIVPEDTAGHKCNIDAILASETLSASVSWASFRPTGCCTIRILGRWSGRSNC